MKTQYCLALLLLLVPGNRAILVNVALGKKTEQFGRQGTWPSSNAVDGVKECQNINDKYLTLSGYSDLPWWKLDLGGLFQIHQVNIFGRNDAQFSRFKDSW
ncbi:uncharacterized protein LOC132723858 [Ruditapes philippinarum]|uniref:uncharacterized protein LOC132723858 n=1 Tax=Ruditapes philippinarum TaxID=129788 RepID=UPI00295A71D5|nr:uncharacterized protein LOC132723858 [Ruditapes philippinarum]